MAFDISMVRIVIFRKLADSVLAQRRQHYERCAPHQQPLGHRPLPASHPAFKTAYWLASLVLSLSRSLIDSQ